MDDMDLRRRIGWFQAEAKARARLALLWQRQRQTVGGSAAECVKIAKEPLRRLEGLRRRPGTQRAPVS